MAVARGVSPNSSNQLASSIFQYNVPRRLLPCLSKGLPMMVSNVRIGSVLLRDGMSLERLVMPRLSSIRIC